MLMEEKIQNIDETLEIIRDTMLGLDTSLIDYTLDENYNFDKKKINKLVDTLLFYIMQENILYNKDDMKFYRYAITSMIFLNTNIEILELEDMTFGMLVTTAEIIEEDPETFFEVLTNSYLTLKPNFLLAALDNVQDINNVTEEELKKATFSEATKEQEIELRKQWEEEHLNCKMADEIFKYNQTFLSLYDFMPDDFAPVFENSVCKFLNDEGKGFYDKKYLEKIKKQLLTAIEKKNQIK